MPICHVCVPEVSVPCILTKSSGHLPVSWSPCWFIHSINMYNVLMMYLVLFWMLFRILGTQPEQNRQTPSPSWTDGLVEEADNEKIK